MCVCLFVCLCLSLSIHAVQAFFWAQILHDDFRMTQDDFRMTQSTQRAISKNSESTQGTQTALRRHSESTLRTRELDFLIPSKRSLKYFVLFVLYQSPHAHTHYFGFKGGIIWTPKSFKTRPTVLHCQAPYTRLQVLGLGYRNIGILFLFPLGHSDLLY